MRWRGSGDGLGQSRHDARAMQQAAIAAGKLPDTTTARAARIDQLDAEQRDECRKLGPPFD